MNVSTFKLSIIVLAVALAWPQFAIAATYRLTVETADVKVGDHTVQKMTVNGSVPGPLLRLKEGEDATIIVTNKTDEPTSVHWHGLLLPGMMDGAPGFNGFMGIKPGERFTYTFRIRQSGTYWYHSHTGTQDQSVFGALVIDPKAPSRLRYDRDYVVLLGDATPENSDQVLRNLKADSEYYNYARRTVGDFFRDAKKDGFGAALRDRLDWGEMRMDPTDLSDVSGYTFILNGKSPQENETFLFKKGERLRLRLINGSAMTIFDVRIPGLEMKVVAADGQDVAPTPVDELRIGVAERYDLIVEPTEDIPYTLFAEAIDRTGYARATLSSAIGQQGPIPDPRPRSILTMEDMGMAMDHGAMGHGDTPGDDMQGMDHGDTAEDDMQSMDHGKMGHGAAGQADGNGRPRGWAAGFPKDATVLDYAMLKSITPNADVRAPTREIKVRLTGNMERYMWSLNDKKFGDAPPIRVRYGERVRLTFANETMMAHPVHLHGQFFELENGATDRKPLKDTVLIPPGKSVSVVLTAKEVGAWPLHCHLLYHMEAGMMTRFVVEPPGVAADQVTPNAGTIALTPHDESGDGMMKAMGHGEHK